MGRSWPAVFLSCAVACTYSGSTETKDLTCQQALEIVSACRTTPDPARCSDGAPAVERLGEDDCAALTRSKSDWLTGLIE
jgi:hypothetical protein